MLACTCTAISARAWLVSATSPSIPAVLRPVLRCVTCRTLTSVLLQLRSDQLLQVPGRRPVTLLHRLEDPAAQPPYLLLMVTPVHMLPGVTIKRGQALRSVHRSVQLARQFRHLRSLRLKGSPAHVSALSSPVARPASGPVIRGPSGRSSRSCGPAFLPPFGRPASASWAPCPAREFSPPYGRLTAPPAHTRAWDADP